MFEECKAFVKHKVIMSLALCLLGKNAERCISNVLFCILFIVDTIMDNSHIYMGFNPIN